jgi:hypothetical protein
MSGLCPTTGEGVTQVVPLSIEYWYVTKGADSSKQIMPWLPLIPTATKLVGALRVSSGAEGRWNTLADRSPCPWLGGNLSFPEGSAERAEEKIPTTVSASRATLGNEEAPNRVPQIKNETRTGGAHLFFLTKRKSDPKGACVKDFFIVVLGWKYDIKGIQSMWRKYTPTQQAPRPQNFISCQIDLFFRTPSAYICRKITT